MGKKKKEVKATSKKPPSRELKMHELKAIVYGECLIDGSDDKQRKIFKQQLVQLGFTDNLSFKSSWQKIIATGLHYKIFEMYLADTKACLQIVGENIEKEKARVSQILEAMDKKYLPCPDDPKTITVSALVQGEN